MNKNKVILDDDDEEEMKPEEEENKPVEEKQENKESSEKSQNKEKTENKEEEIKEEVKKKKKENISSPKKEIEEKPKEKTTEKKVESTPIKKENKINNSNNSIQKTNKSNNEIKISKGSQQKPIIKPNNDISKIKKKNDENTNNERDIDKDYYEQERIRKIKASLEKYRVKEPEFVKKKPIINPNIQHKQIHKHKIIEHKDKASIIDNIFKSGSKKSIKSETKIEKKETSLIQKENKDKDKSDIINDNKKDLLNKKREREDKEKTEKKEKSNIIPKKEIKKPKPLTQNKILEDDEDEDEDESDSDYDVDKSYSDNDDESESSEESFPSESSQKKKHAPSIHKKLKIKPKPSIKSFKKVSDISSVKKTSLKPKGILVNELLKRWWYALPPWPPENFDTSEKLKDNKLRLVKIIDWKKEPKLDKDNFEKCFELPGFKYVYLNNDGKIFDLRPKEGMPSYNNLIKLTDVKLHEYLAKALKGQLEVLEKKNSINEKELRQEIKEQLDKEEKTLARLKV